MDGVLAQSLGAHRPRSDRVGRDRALGDVGLGDLGSGAGKCSDVASEGDDQGGVPVPGAGRFSFGLLISASLALPGIGRIESRFEHR